MKLITSCSVIQETHNVSTVQYPKTNDIIVENPEAATIHTDNGHMSEGTDNISIITKNMTLQIWWHFKGL